MRQVGQMTGNTGKNDSNRPKSNSATKTSKTAWQIPVGLARGNWDYVNSGRIANDYDAFLDAHPLSEIDESVFARYFPDVAANRDTNSTWIVDFGAGTGRSLLPLMKRGYSGLAVDLSIPMLRRLRQKLSNSGLESSDALQVQANLVELDGVATDAADHGICMFSTLGMIQGRTNRRNFLKHANRIIKSNGVFVVHAHNVWHQAFLPQGFGRIMAGLFRSVLGSQEFGDQKSSYRGLKDFLIHSYRRRELATDLTESGFEKQTWFGISTTNQIDEAANRWNSSGTVGWIVVCESPS